MTPQEQYNLMTYVLGGLHAFVFIVGWPLFVIRRNYEPIRSRLWVLAAIQTVAGLLHHLITAIGPIRTGCFLYNFRYALIPVWGYPYAIRGFMLLGNYLLQNAMLHLRNLRGQSSSHGRTSNHTDPVDLANPNVSQTENEATNNISMNVRVSGSRHNSENSENGQEKLPNPNLGDLPEIPEFEEMARRGNERHQDVAIPPLKMSQGMFKMAGWFARHRWVLSWKFEVISCLVLFVFFLLIVVLRYYKEPWVYPPEIRDDPTLLLPDRCDQTRNLIMTGVQAIIALPLLGFSCYFLWSVKDAFYLKNELTIVFFTAIVIIPLWIIGNTDIFPPFMSRFFWVFVTYIFMDVNTLWVPVIISFVFSKKIANAGVKEGGASPNEVELGAPKAVGMEVIDKIFDEPHLAASFAEFTKLSWCYENFLFYDDARRYRLLPDRKLPSEAKRIWKTYFRVGAPNEVNIDDSRREEVMENIEQKRFTRQVFVEAEKDIRKLLRQSVFPLWESTESCKNAMQQAGIQSFAALVNASTP